MPDYIVGLDLGQATDPTPYCVVKRSLVLSNGMPVRGRRGGLVVHFDCVFLEEQLPLLTPYPAIVAAVKTLLGKPELGANPKLAVDATGVGRAVVDMFLDAQLPASLWPITITAGHEWSTVTYRPGQVGFHVPKLELASTMQAALASGRLKFAQGLKEAETARRELLAFEVKTTKAGNDTFNARQGKHDDIVLALAVAMWLGELPRMTPLAATEHGLDRLQGKGPIVGPLPRESAALADEHAQEQAALNLQRQADQAKKEATWRNPANPAFWR